MTNAGIRRTWTSVVQHKTTRGAQQLEPGRRAAIGVEMQDRHGDQEQPGIDLGRFRFTSTGVVVDHARPPALDAWAGPLKFALWAQQASPWWIGDLLNAGDAHFGEMFSQVCEGAVSADQLQRYESIARRVPRENRRPGLSWSAHAAVARLPHAMQRTMLARAEESGWTSAVLSRKVREEIARGKQPESLSEADNGEREEM